MDETKPKRPRVQLPSLSHDFLSKTSAPFQPSCLISGEKGARHNQGNWPSFLQIMLNVRLENVTTHNHDDSDESDDGEDNIDSLTFIQQAHDAVGRVTNLLAEDKNNFNNYLHIPKVKASSDADDDNDDNDDDEDENSKTDKITNKTEVVSSFGDTNFDWAHISLAKPFALRKHEIKPFQNSLIKALEHISSFEIGISSTSRFLHSDNKQRSFLALDVASGHKSLMKLLACIDQTLLKFARPPYYNPPIFHVSIGEMNSKLFHKYIEVQSQENGGSNGQADDMNPCDRCNAVTQSMSGSPGRVSYFDIDEVIFKAGNQRHSFRLKLK